MKASSSRIFVLKLIFAALVMLFAASCSRNLQKTTPHLHGPPQCARFRFDNRNSGKSDFTVVHDLEQIWEIEGKVPFFNSPTISNDNVLYIGSEDGFLYSISSDGKIKWKCFLDGDWICASPTIRKNGDLIVGTYSGAIYSITPEGVKKRLCILGSGTSSSPLIINNRIIVGSEDRNLYCIDFRGKIVWKAACGARMVWASPASDSEGNLYITNENGVVLSFDNKGGLRWKFDTKGKIRDYPVLSREDEIFVTNEKGRLWCFDRQGILMWRIDIDAKTPSAPAVDNQRIYLTTDNGRVICFNKNGKKMWDTRFDQICLSPVSIDNEDNIFVGGNYGFYKLDSSGRVVDSLFRNTPGAPESPPVFDKRGRIYVNNFERKKIFAFGSGKSTSNLSYKRHTGLVLQLWQKKDLNDANRFIKDGKFDRARVILDRLEGSLYRVPHYFFIKAELEHKTGDAMEARKNYREAIALFQDPELNEFRGILQDSLYKLGMLEAQKGNFGVSIKYYEKALKFQPYDIKINIAMADAYFDKGDKRKALRIIKELLSNADAKKKRMIHMYLLGFPRLKKLTE